ncbi:MAG: HhH-GPD family protein [Acidimicrobiales bacterium]|jgi:uncharacterized HhH-GPD family protein|nr:HhH-GPD family protein [Acidimicrobiales bacterium]
MTCTLPLTGDDPADQLLEDDPLALLIGMLLDQQVPMEKAFHSPYDLRERLGGRLDCVEIAAVDPAKLVEIFSERPALHRFPGSMAARTQAMCQALVDDFDGRAEQVWAGAADGPDLLARLTSLPGFGTQKAQIFTALLAKRLGVTPAGWELAAGAYAEPGHRSIADIDGPDAFAAVRAYKRDMKAKAKAKSES